MEIFAGAVIALSIFFISLQVDDADRHNPWKQGESNKNP